MSFLESGRWQELYLGVISETNEDERRKKAQIAAAAMRNRTNALKRRRDTESILEVQALTAALDKLASLTPQEQETHVLTIQAQERTSRRRPTE